MGKSTKRFNLCSQVFELTLKTYQKLVLVN